MAFQISLNKKFDDEKDLKLQFGIDNEKILLNIEDNAFFDSDLKMIGEIPKKKNNKKRKNTKRIENNSNIKQLENKKNNSKKLKEHKDE